MSAAAPPLTDVRCPYCGALWFRASATATLVVEIKCPRGTCRKLTTVSLPLLKGVN